MMTVRFFVFLFMLAQVAFVSVHVSAANTAKTIVSEKQRNASALVSGYVESNQLFLFFGVPVDYAYLQITDVATGCIVFPERISGDSEASASGLFIEDSNTGATYEE